MVKKARESNIELLRILSILGVILLHYNHPDIGGAMAAARPGSINQIFVYFTESVFIVAVNLFILITGYFLSTSQKRQPYKILWLFVQVIAFSLGLYIVEIILGSATFSWKTLLMELVPDNYFVLLYSTLYFISPYINLLLQKMERSALRKMLILFGILFSVLPTLVDLSGDILNKSWNGLYTISSQGSQQGYTMVNFVLMYMLGAYLRRDDSKQEKPAHLVLAILGNAVLLTLWSFLGNSFGLPTDRSGLAYCNPLIIINAVLIFRLFQHITIKESRIINGLAKGVFTVFLLHIQLFRFTDIPAFAAGNPLIMVLHMVCTCIISYLVCWCIFFVYDRITRPIFAFIESKLPLRELDVPSL